MIKRFLAIALALLIPACGGRSDSEYTLHGPGIPVNPDTITLDVANADGVPYNLSAWEYANGSPLTQILVCWPIPEKGSAAFSQQTRSITFHADSAVYTHSINLYSTSGTLLDTKPFIKGAGQLFVAVTIQGAVMDVQTVQF